MQVHTARAAHGADGKTTGTNEGAWSAGSGLPSWRRHLCTTLALIPCDKAMLATDAPGSAHSARICCLTSALYLRRVFFLASFMVSTYLLGRHHRCRLGQCIQGWDGRALTKHRTFRASTKSTPPGDSCPMRFARGNGSRPPQSATYLRIWRAFTCRRGCDSCPATRRALAIVHTACFHIGGSTR